MAPKLNKTPALRASFSFGEATIGLGKTDHQAVIAIDDLPEHVRVYLMHYGLKQCLNDAAAGGKTHEEKTALFDKRLGNLREGVLRATRSVEAADPLAKHAKDIATAFARRKGLSGDTLKAWVARAVLSDSVRELAQRRLDEERALGDLDLGTADDATDDE